MATHTIVVDLQVKGLSSFGSSMRQAQRFMGGVGGGSPGGVPPNSATQGLRNVTTQNARNWQQYQRQVQRGMMMKGGGGGGIGETVAMAVVSKLVPLVAAMDLFRRALSGGAAAAQNFNQNMYGAAGLSQGQAAQMNYGSGFSGVDAAGWAGIHARVKQGGIAYSELNRQYGYHPNPGPYEDISPGPTAEYVTRFLRDPKVDQKRKDLLLNELGAPGLGKYEYMPEGEYQSQKNAGFGMDQKTQAAIDAKENRFDRGFERAMSGMHWKAWVTDIGDTIDKALHWLNPNPMPGMIPGNGEVPGDKGGGGGGEGKGWVTSWLEGMMKLNDSVKDLNNTVRENTTLLKNGAGVGGGRNASNLPMSYWVRLMGQEADEAANRVGAFK